MFSRTAQAYSHMYTQGLPVRTTSDWLMNMTTPIVHNKMPTALFTKFMHGTMILVWYLCVKQISGK